MDCDLGWDFGDLFWGFDGDGRMVGVSCGFDLSWRLRVTWFILVKMWTERCGWMGFVDVLLVD